MLNEVAHRLACAALLAVGVATIAATGPFPLDAALVAQHRDALVLLLGAVLCLAAVVPALRMPAIGAGSLVKVTWLTVAGFQGGVSAALLLGELAMLGLLAAAFAVFLRETRLESRWDSALPSRQEA